MVRALSNPLNSGKALHILVVEDDEDSRDMMVEFLRLIGGHSIEVAQTGEDGLRRLRSEPAVDVLFTDVGLPGMDGIEMLDHAVKEGLIAIEHVVICSAHMTPRFDPRASGAHCIPKPLDTNQIIKTVRTIAEEISRKVG